MKLPFGSRSPLYRKYKTADDGRSFADIDSYYGARYSVGYEKFVSFLGDLREQINKGTCRVWPVWDPNDYYIGLEFMLSDYGVISSDEWHGVADYMDERERKMYMFAEEHNINLRQYQAGRRLCLLPPDVVAIFGEYPEVHQCVAEYQCGLDAGIVEWLRGPSPEVPAYLRRIERRVIR